MMVEDVKAALQPFMKHLTITDEGDTIRVTLKDYIKDFNAVKDIAKGFGGKYTPFNRKTEEKAFFIIPKKAAPNRMEGTVIDDVISGLESYAKEAEDRAKSFQQMAEDLRRAKK